MPSKKKVSRPSVAAADNKVKYATVKSLFVGGCVDGQIEEVINAEVLTYTVGKETSTYNRQALRIGQTQMILFTVEGLELLDAMARLFNVYNAYFMGQKQPVSTKKAE